MSFSDFASLSFHPYELVARSPLNAVSERVERVGALLRVELQDGSIGYGDCHPWIELGDVPLSAQLERLREGQLTQLTERSLYFARLDAGFRARGRSAFEGLEIPASHELMTAIDELTSERLQALAGQGFTRVKIKTGRDPEAEAAAIVQAWTGLGPDTALRLRPDFNGSLDPARIDAFLARLGEARAGLDFVEDPFPFEPSSWGELQTRHRVSFALDRDNDPWVGKPDLAPVWVIKPAVQDAERFIAAAESGLHVPVTPRMVFTSYLDHPLGQACAAYEAARIYRQTAAPDVCGLLSHRAYEPTDFSEALVADGPRLQAPEGTGFGFDELLKGLGWRILR